MQPFSVEHISAPSREGESSWEKLALSCQGCNNHKYNHIKGFDPATGGVSLLFHPPPRTLARTFRLECRTRLSSSAFLRPAGRPLRRSASTARAGQPPRHPRGRRRTSTARSIRVRRRVSGRRPGPAGIASTRSPTRPDLLWSGSATRTAGGPGRSSHHVGIRDAGSIVAISCAARWPPRRPGRWESRGRTRRVPPARRGRLDPGGGRRLPRPVRRGLAAAGDGRERGVVGRVDRRDRGPHRRPGRRRTRRSTSSSARPRSSTRSSGCSSTKGELDDLTVRQLEKVRLRAAEAPGTIPEVVKARTEAEAEAVGRAGRVRLHASSARARPTSTASANDIDRVLVELARPGRAARRLGGVQDDRRPAPRRAAAAPRPAQQGRPRAGLRRLLRAPGRRLRHDRPRDDRPVRRLVAEVKPLYEQLHTWAKHALAKRYKAEVPDGQDPRPLAAQPLGPELARPGRGGRHGRPVQGQDRRSTSPSRPSGSTSRSASPSCPTSFWAKSDLYPADPKTGPQEEQPRQRLAHRPARRRPQPDVDRARQPLVHHGAPRARAHLLLHQLLDAPRCPSCSAPGRTGRSTRGSAT